MERKEDLSDQILMPFVLAYLFLWLPVLMFFLWPVLVDGGITVAKIYFGAALPLAAPLIAMALLCHWEGKRQRKERVCAPE